MPEQSTCCAPSCCSEEGPSQQNKSSDDIRNHVRESYSKVAEANNKNEANGITSSCCGVSDDIDINTLNSLRLGYSMMI